MNSELKITLINLDVWDKYQCKPISKIVTSNNDRSRSNLATKYKAQTTTEPKNNKIKRVEYRKQYTKDLFTQFGLISSLHMEERVLSTSLSISSLQTYIEKSYKF